jgi:hypothetical protein
MNNQFARFDPGSWQEGGVLIARGAAKPSVGADIRKKPWNAKIVVCVAGIAAAGTLGLRLPTKVIGQRTNYAVNAYLASAPKRVVMSQLTKEQRADPDYVDPSYWSAVAAYVRDLPPLPPEAEGEGPELPDLSA